MNDIHTTNDRTQYLLLIYVGDIQLLSSKGIPHTINPPRLASVRER